MTRSQKFGSFDAVLFGVVDDVDIGTLNGCFGKKLKFAALANVDKISKTCLIIDGHACGLIDI